MCQIISQFQCPDLPVTHGGDSKPTLSVFIAYALYRTRYPSDIAFAAIALLVRIKQRFPAARATSGHRLFISAFMIASKVMYDYTYSSQSWCVVGQTMFKPSEVNKMEREMCMHLQWNLNVTADQVVEAEARVRATARMPATSLLPTAQCWVCPVNLTTVVRAQYCCPSISNPAPAACLSPTDGGLSHPPLG